MADKASMERVVAGMINSLYSLPLEVCWLISQHLPRFYSTAVTLSSCLRTSEDILVVLSRKVWAQYIKHHDKAYLWSLSNIFHGKIPGVVTLLAHNPDSPIHAQAPKHIYVAHDPWGIRRILFQPPPSVTQTMNIWWETLPVGHLGQLTGKTDV